MALEIGTRRELLVDEWLVESRQGVRLELHRPERREHSLVLDAPWEDCVAFPVSVVPWDEGWRLYYRAGILDLAHEEDASVVALAESRDGLHYTRPELGQCDFAGSRRNSPSRNPHDISDRSPEPAVRVPGQCRVVCRGKTRDRG